MDFPSKWIKLSFLTPNHKKRVSIKKTWWRSIHSTLVDPFLFSGAPNSRSACPYRCYLMCIYDVFATYMYLSHFICFISCVGLLKIGVLKIIMKLKLTIVNKENYPSLKHEVCVCGSVCHWHCRWGESLHMSTLRVLAWPLQCHMLPRCILAIVLHWGDLWKEEEGREWRKG